MKTKKIIVTTLATMVLMSGTVNCVMGNNYTDKGFNFQITSDKRSTNPREKQDASSATVKITSGSGSAVVMVNGLTSKNSQSMVDLTYGTHKIVKKSNIYTYLPNMVYETKNANGTRAYPYANLSFRSAVSYSWDATGVWSPDSI